MSSTIPCNSPGGFLKHMFNYKPSNWGFFFTIPVLGFTCSFLSLLLHFLLFSAIWPLRSVVHLHIANHCPVRPIHVCPSCPCKLLTQMTGITSGRFSLCDLVPPFAKKQCGWTGMGELASTVPVIWGNKIRVLCGGNDVIWVGACTGSKVRYYHFNMGLWYLNPFHICVNL